MNDQAVAYSLSLTHEAGISINDDPRGMVNVFTSSEECRTSLQNAPTAVPVIVCNGFGAVTAINLAAALCADVPERDVYLMEDNPTEALASRARSAGIRGILNRLQAMRLLQMDLTQPVMRPQLPEPERLVFDGLQQPSDHVPQESPVVLREHTPQAAPINRVGQGRVIGFLSGRGGVGKSTVALMTAFLAKQGGARVALVDLDLQFGDIDYLAGREPGGTICRFSLEQMCMDASAPEYPDDAMMLIVPPKHPEQGESYIAHIPALLSSLAAQRDLVVVNTGAFWTETHAQIAQSCDYLAFLMDQRATSVEACKQVADLCLRMQLPQARFLYLLNGCGKRAPLSTLDVSLALGGVEVAGIADGGPLVDELLALGCPLELLASENAFVTSLEILLDPILGHMGTKEAQKPEGTQGNAMGRILDFSSFKNLFGGMSRVAT